MIADTINDMLTQAGNAEGTFLANRYRVVRQLGRGGMGSVWLVEDSQLDNKPFAIKMLPSILVSNRRAYRQLKDEALVAMKLTHPNIVTLRAFEENNGNPFLVMDYIEGQTLDEYLAENGNLSEDELLRVLRPIAVALDYAHGEGVVHRDVKPANVMVRKDGHPFILDFGIAREIQETLTRVTGRLSGGTLLYMSPDQIRGELPKPAQDVYSFAAMAYECIKGEPPFVRGAIEDQIKNQPPPPLVGRVALNAHLAASIMAGLAKKPEDRPPTCLSVLVPAVHVQKAVPQQPALKAQPDSSHSKGGRRWKLVFTVSLLLLAVIGGAVWHYHQGRKQVQSAVVKRPEIETARRKAEEESRQKAAAEEARRKAEEESRQKAAAEEARRKAEEEARQKDVAEEARRKFEAVDTVRREAYEAQKNVLEDEGNERNVKQWNEAVAALKNGNSKYEAHDLDGATAEYKCALRLLRSIPMRIENPLLLHPKPGQEAVLTLPGGVPMVLIYVEAGSFMMGAANGDDDERPVHNVTLAKGFWMGKYEVTQAQWKSVLMCNPSHFKGNDLPVESISWNDCQEFINRVNAMLGKGAVRLPTEAEWEYACRAGTADDFGGTENMQDVGWCEANSGGKTHPVGQKKANGWGFHDMHGNVWEWCSDFYGRYSGEDAVDPMGYAVDGLRVLRGGSWFNMECLCRSAHRSKYAHGDRDDIIGFRLVCSEELRKTVATAEALTRAKEEIRNSARKMGEAKVAMDKAFDAQQKASDCGGAKLSIDAWNEAVDTLKMGNEKYEAYDFDGAKTIYENAERLFANISARAERGISSDDIQKGDKKK